MALHHMLRAAAGASAPSDPNFENVTLLLTGDGTNGAQNNTFLDSSSNNFTITRNGNTTQGTFSPYGNLWSNYFDGSGDYLVAGSSSSFNFMHNSSALFTWEAFVYLPSASTTQTIIDNCNATTAQTGVQIQLSSSKLVLFIGRGVAGTNVAFGSSTGDVPSNQWVHLAITYDQSLSSNNGTFYINGVASGTVSKTANAPSSGNAYSSLNIGCYGAGAGQFVTGYISNIRITNSIVYTSNFTPSTTPLTAVSGTSLLTCQSNRFIDNSSNNFTLTVNGNTSVQRFSPFNPTAPYSATTIGGSGYFDGSGDYLSVGSAANWTFLNNGSDWTVEFDVFHSSTSEISIATTTTTASQIGVGIFLNYSLNAVGVQFYRGVSGSYATFISSAYLQINQWNHVAITFANTGKTCSFYINGVAAGSSSNTGFAYSSSNPAYTLTVAAAANDPSITLLTGYLANLRISDNVRTGLTTLPTAPYTSDANTKLLCNFTNAGIPDAAMMNDLETVGNAQVSTSVKKYGTGSLYFDGTGDYLSVPSSQNFNLGTGDFTVEFWLYPLSNNTYTTYLSGVVSGQSCRIGLEGAGMMVYKTSAGKFIQDSTVPPTNTWTHYAIVRSGNNFIIYRNGTSVATATNSTSIDFSAVTKIASGWDTGADVNGYIDDLRITKGYARYTANFTPPAATLPTF